MARNYKYMVFVMRKNDIIAHRCFVTEEAKNNYCNKCYNRFGEDVVCDVRDFDTFETLETWAS